MTTQSVGVVVAVLLTGALLLREAVALGLLEVSTAFRRALNGSIVGLAVGFLVAITVHLLTL